MTFQVLQEMLGMGPEEFEEDEFDFYELKAAWIGCMEPRASNYNSAATIDDNSCTESDTCAHRRGDGTCPNCIAEGQCAAGTNDGYRNRDHDTVWASKVAKGSIQVDGDLSDWMNHMHGDRCYTDVAFARADGEEVIFEAYAGSLYADEDDEDEDGGADGAAGARDRPKRLDRAELIHFLQARASEICLWPRTARAGEHRRHDRGSQG